MGVKTDSLLDENNSCETALNKAFVRRHGPNRTGYLYNAQGTQTTAISLPLSVSYAPIQKQHVPLRVFDAIRHIFRAVNPEHRAFDVVREVHGRRSGPSVAQGLDGEQAYTGSHGGVVELRAEEVGGGHEGVDEHERRLRRVVRQGAPVSVRIGVLSVLWRICRIKVVHTRRRSIGAYARSKETCSHLVSLISSSTGKQARLLTRNNYQTTTEIELCQ